MKISLNATVKLCALLVLVIAGMVLSGSGFGPAPQSAEAAALTEVKKLLASDAQALDNFGRSVAISGDTAVVGLDTFFSSGGAYILERDRGGADNWGEVKKLTGSDAGATERFGSRVAISGDIAVVGAWLEGPGRPGAAYVFHRNQGGTDNWGQVKKLTASDGGIRPRFGFSVAVSGDTAVVGALSDGTCCGGFPGAAYVFQRDHGGTDNWGEVKKLTASDAQAFDNFGFSVAVSGDTAIVGAIAEDGGGTLNSNFGAAYVFERDEGSQDNWGEVAKLNDSDAQEEDRFGHSVAVSGNTVIVGAEGATRGINPFPFPFSTAGPGLAYVFERDAGGAGNWGEVKKLLASDGQDGDFFSFSVTISGDNAVIGAHQADVAAPFSGAAYIFQRDAGGTDNWGEVKKLLASDGHFGDSFGISVAVSGQTVLAGAPFENEAGVQAGAAYVFEAPPPDGDGDGVPDDEDACPGTAAGATVDANGCSDAQVDDDADGVCDPGAPSGGPSGCTGSDACPGTPAGEAVDANGCTPTQAMENLLDDVDSLGLPNGVANSLTASLNQATANLNDGNPNNDAAVCGNLTALINEVNAMEQNGQLTPTEAEELRQAAEDIKAALGC